MSLCRTEDIVPSQKQYTNFFTANLCTLNTFATPRYFAQLNSVQNNGGSHREWNWHSHGYLRLCISVQSSSSDPSIVQDLSLLSVTGNSLVWTLFLHQWVATTRCRTEDMGSFVALHPAAHCALVCLLNSPWPHGSACSLSAQQVACTLWTRWKRCDYSSCLCYVSTGFRFDSFPC